MYRSIWAGAERERGGSAADGRRQLGGGRGCGRGARAALVARGARRVRGRARAARPRLEVARPGRPAPRARHRHLRPAQRMGRRQVRTYTAANIHCYTLIVTVSLFSSEPM